MFSERLYFNIEEMGYRVSKFIYHKGCKKLVNDLTEQIIYMTPGQRTVYDLMAHSREIPEELAGTFNGMVEAGVFVPEELDETCKYNILKLDIDVNTHCNASCVYCPQSTHKRGVRVMSFELFTKIIDRFDGYNLKWVALHIYGEPLLDPLYRKRVEYLKEKEMRLHFFTNGSMLSKDLTDFLKDKNIFGAMFNFPSIDCEEWKYMTKLSDRHFLRAKEGIEYFIGTFAGRLEHLEIVVNGNTDNHEERTLAIKEHFSKFGDVIVNGWDSNSRAGTLENEFVKSISHQHAEFCGCPRVVNQLHINIEGDVILCCQDYFQSIKLGNILTDSVEEIMNSERMRSVRAQVYGLAPMEESLLCRSCTMIRTR